MHSFPNSNNKATSISQTLGEWKQQHYNPTKSYRNARHRMIQHFLVNHGNQKRKQVKY